MFGFGPSQEMGDTCCKQYRENLTHGNVIVPHKVKSAWQAPGKFMSHRFYIATQNKCQTFAVQLPGGKGGLAEKARRILNYKFAFPIEMPQSLT